jgi:hypothetical protein
MRYRQILIFYFLLSSFIAVSAQYYETGQDPASIKWMQIKTGRFTVIYPENYSSWGISYAKSLEESYSKLGSLFPEKKFTLPVVIHNFTIQSNGYVSWAPRRMELYPTPDQNSLPLSAVTQLTVHELTHVRQMESLNQGFSKVMSLFFGEQFTGIVASLLPSWFLEGDAVFAESALTKSGRGRDPSFQKQLKALIVENKRKLTYDKILNGSYKVFIPDIYESGFQMVTWALTKNDPQIWNKVLKYTAEQPFTLNPVNISLSRSSGLRKKSLWIETADTLKNIWTREIIRNSPANYEGVNPDKHGKYINYTSPVFAGTDSIIAIKSSLSYPSSFVLINPVRKTEKRIFVPGQVYPLFLSYARNRLVWVETESDLRWENREYSVIKLLDLKTNRVKKLSRKTRYLAASISPDGRKIAAIENTVSNKNNLIIIDSETGAVIESVHTPGNVYLQHPQWSENGAKITTIFLSEDGEGIMSFKPDNHEWETLIEAARNNLQSSFLRNDSLYFISSSSGTDNIYLRAPDKKIVRLSNSRYGTVDVSNGYNKLIFSDYSLSGNNIGLTAFPKTSLPSVDEKNSSSFLINRFDIKPPAGNTDSSTFYSPVPYRKWEHLFRFHSWMPFYADIEEVKADPASIRPGVSLMTQNTLSTLISTIGYEYSADRRNVIHSRITWKGWYPVIESQLDYGTVPQISKMGETVSNPSDIKQGIGFLNTISLPLQVSSGRFSEFFQPSLSMDYLNNYIYLPDKNMYDYGQTIVTGRVYFSNYYRSAIRDIYPMWAQIIDFNYRFAPFDKTIYGSTISLKTAFYFPGILPNNSIKIRLQTEKQNPRKYLFLNFTSFPRGYTNLISTEIQFLSVDYVLPLVYPDFNVASFLYLKRIRTGLFYDYATGPGKSFYEYTASGLTHLFSYPEDPLYLNHEKASFKSFGVELLADFHLLRIPFMISGGVQAAWKSVYESPSFEFLFNIDLFGMTIGKRRI